MQILVISNEAQKAELTNSLEQIPDNILWTDSISNAASHQTADVVVDLLFDQDHLSNLQAFSNKLVIVNSVAHTLSELLPGMVRINGWNGFLSKNLIEASAGAESRQKAEEVFSRFNKKLEWVPDQPGFISCRVIAMIINEAYLALSEGVSTRDEINTAMKLGTNYPYGPFEWAEVIGKDQILSLLQQMALIDAKYQPAPNLIKEHNS